MRALKLALCAICLSLVMGISGPGQAQLGGGGGGTFQLEVCNKYGKLIALALVNRTAPNEDRFVIHGWYGIEPGKCAGGQLPLGNVGLFGFADAGNNQFKTWGGDVQLCVSLGKNFKRVLTPNYRCRRENNEIAVGFGVLQVTDKPEVSITLE
jgi:uncharacterized membrane protein